MAIVDGDTLDCLLNKEVFRVRLYGIDAPEKKQAYGSRARQRLSELAFGQFVSVIPLSQEKYGRYIADITLQNNLNLSQEMLISGLAWWYKIYAADNLKFEQSELEARTKRLGLWSENKPIPPWEYRQTIHQH